MKSWTKPTIEMIDKVLSSVKKETDRQYFFSKLNNPLWVKPIAERGYFKNPPGISHLPDGYIHCPNWPELAYLINIAIEATDEVIDILLSLPKTNNPRIYDGILEIALKLEGGESAKLLPKILEYTELKHQFSVHRYPELLSHWTKQNNLNEALEIVKKLIPFEEDPKAQEKRKLRKKNPNEYGTTLEPAPRYGEWEYQEILEKGVRPLAEREPFQVAQILINVTANMIWMEFHQEELDKGRDEDYSEIWCRRLAHPDRDHHNSKENLVHTLTFACEQVFDKAPDSVDALDQTLRKQRWKVFKRLRQHLYALHLDDRTLPWIRELIINHDDYAKWEHHYEFQLMVRKACEHFGTRLLSESERKTIFDLILSGPSKEGFREWMGDQYSEEAFRRRQRYFHRKQLRPFAVLLDEDCRRYLDELEIENKDKPLTDEDFSPYGAVTGGCVSYQSPKPAEDLAKLSDEELLAYINEWNEEHHDKDNWLIEINITGLVGVFQTIFKDAIIPDDKRLAFWIKHRDNISRPVYVAAIVKTMQELVKEQKYDKLNLWFEFCDWILQHPDTDRTAGAPEPNDESRERPNWGSSRRAVVDFIDVCVNKDTMVPLTARDELTKLLKKACTQFDWRLDREQPVFINRDDQISVAINNTRSRALESLINFGSWVRYYVPDDAVQEVTQIFDSRLRIDAEIALTKPEYAFLGLNYGRLCALNSDWARDNKSVLFPQGNTSIWREAFGCFVRYNNPKLFTFDMLRQDFELALEKLEDLEGGKESRRDIIDRLGQHLFSYYLWEVYPLKGDESLLARFYQKTADNRERWANLFNHVGRSLRNSGKNLEDSLVDRIIAFFDWRLEACDSLELNEFTFWLDAECLGPEWRLGAYSRILDLRSTKKTGLSIEMDSLVKLLPDHNAKVVQCFAKITDTLDQGSNIYISAEDAKPILKAGLGSGDAQIREDAERARENLLRIGRFDFLEIE
jgi:hypothetical protein